MAQDFVRTFLTGDKALNRLFDELPNNVQKKYARQGTRAGAKEVKDEAVNLVPHDEGDLERTLTVRVAKGPHGRRLAKGEVGHAVTHRDPEVSFHSLFVGFGTKHMDRNDYMIDAMFSKQTAALRASQRAIKAGVERDGAIANRRGKAEK